MSDDLDALEAAARAAQAKYGDDWYSEDFLRQELSNSLPGRDAAYIAALHPAAALALIARVRRAEAALVPIQHLPAGGPSDNIAALQWIAAAMRSKDALEGRADG